MLKIVSIAFTAENLNCDRSFYPRILSKNHILVNQNYSQIKFA